MYRRNDTPAVVQHLELLKLSNNIIEKMVPEDLPKDRRDIDEFGNEIKRGRRRQLVLKLLLFKNLTLN
jgi:hypothetical protein